MGWDAVWKSLTGPLPTRDRAAAEAALWKKLCARQLANIEFSHKAIVDGIAFDFVSKQLDLVIELYDSNVAPTESDNERVAGLRAAGWAVRRYSYDEVLDDIATVLAELETAANDLKWD
jgi:very-short-patch-repair endonuclease